MRLCFNEATAKNCSDTEQDIRLCAEAGFEYIELRLDMIQEYLSHHSVNELQSLLKRHGIRAHALNACYTYAELFGEKDDLARRGAFLENFLSACALAEKLESYHLIVVPPMNPAGFTVPYERTEEEAEADFIRIVRQLSKLAESFGTKLCIEPVGAPKSSVKTVSAADRVIRAVNRDNVGIVLDAYNLYMAYMDSRYEEIALLDKEKIFAVHLNNADAGGPSLEARRLCDTGVIDLNAFLAEIKKKEYQGMASIETFRPEYWNWEPKRVIGEAYRTTRQVLADNGCLE